MPDAALAHLSYLARAEGEASERTRATIRELRLEGYSLRVLGGASGLSKDTIARICREEAA